MIGHLSAGIPSTWQTRVVSATALWLTLFWKYDPIKPNSHSKLMIITHRARWHINSNFCFATISSRNFSTLYPSAITNDSFSAPSRSISGSSLACAVFSEINIIVNGYHHALEQPQHHLEHAYQIIFKTIVTCLHLTDVIYLNICGYNAIYSLNKCQTVIAGRKFWINT